MNIRSIDRFYSNKNEVNMKLQISVIIILLLAILSCTQESEFITNNNINSDLSSTLNKNEPQPIILSALTWNNSNNVNNIINFRNYGWTGIGLFAEWEKEYCQSNWNTAKTQSYSVLYAMLYPDFLANPNPNWSEIIQRIDKAKLNGATWIYIDDFLTGSVKLTNPRNSISKATIDSVCSYAHKKGLLVAVAEDCESTYLRNFIQNPANSKLYEKIDIVMPYGYAKYSTQAYSGETLMYNHLYNFYNYLKNQLKKNVVPVLGYKTVAGQGYNQLGPQSDGTDFIARALNFAYQKRVFYYTEGTLNDRLALTSYLQYRGYLIGTITL